MKKNYFLLIAAFVAVLQLSAQQMPVGNGHHVINPFNPTRAYTLQPASWGPPLNCDTTLTIYGFDFVPPSDSGYVFGNNIYGSTESAERYFASGTVSDVLAFIAYTNATGDSAVAKIYTVTAAGKPNAVTGTSKKVAVTGIDVTMLTDFVFTTPVAVTTKFFADVTYPVTAGDTIALACNTFGCAADTMAAYAKFPSFGGWLNVKTTFGDSTDIAILAVMATFTGIDEPHSNGLTLHGSFPNPAVENTTVKYSILTSSSVSVTVFDLRGTVVKSFTEEQAKGEHQFTVDTQNLSAGNYFYTVHTSNSSLTGKFTVEK